MNFAESRAEGNTCPIVRLRGNFCVFRKEIVVLKIRKRQDLP